MTIIKHRTTDFPSVFDNFFGNRWDTNWDFQPSGNVPAVNVIENNERFKLEVAIPGMTKEDIQVNIDRNLLTIEGKKETEDSKEEENYKRREFFYASFKRSFTLPDSVDQEKIIAKHEHGVLTIDLPKVDSAKVKPTRSVSIK